MSPRPGTEIRLREVPEPRSAPTDTGVWFVVGLSERGPTTPTPVESLDDYLRLYGDRVTYGLLYDALDMFFHEGGHRAWISRVVGPAAVKSTRNLVDAGAAISLVATALNEGDWGNQLQVGVAAGSVGGTFVIYINYKGVEVERSSDLVAQADAVAWSQYSDWLRLTLGVSANDPAVAAAASLAGGTDDRTNVVDSHWQVALDKFALTIGPGQVSAPGQTTTTRHGQLLTHAATRNRVALIDLPDSSSKATLKGAALALNIDDYWGGGFAPWLVIPGILQGTTRVVPPSSLVAGLCSRNDVSSSPNIAAAGEMGQSIHAIGLSQLEWSDTDRADMNEAGINVIKTVYGGIRVYGFRTLADPVNKHNWINLGASRLIMAIKAFGDEILERFVFDQIDGRGKLFGELEGQLTSMLMGYYNLGSLYGTVPGEAFYVDTSSKVNTPAKIYNNELHAVVAIRVSPMAEWVVMELVKVPTLEAVA